MGRKYALALVGIVGMAGAIVLAQPASNTKPGKPTQPADAGQPEIPGMSGEDMQALMEAATPGPMHAWMLEGVGTWHGQTKHWMAPNTEPTLGECVGVVTPLMDGKFTKTEVTGEMVGMGPFSGLGIYGYDNVSKEFQSTWLDNFGTGMMIGKGSLSDDHKTLTWEFSYNCPITKKACTMREIEKRVNKNTFTLEMHGADPHTGVVFKMMEITFTRKAEANVGTR